MGRGDGVWRWDVVMRGVSGACVTRRLATRGLVAPRPPYMRAHAKLASRCTPPLWPWSTLVPSTHEPASTKMSASTKGRAASAPGPRNALGVCSLS